MAAIWTARQLAASLDAVWTVLPMNRARLLHMQAPVLSLLHRFTDR